MITADKDFTIIADSREIFSSACFIFCTAITNDRDNQYTIKISVFDDSGASHAAGQQIGGYILTTDSTGLLTNTASGADNVAKFINLVYQYAQDYLSGISPNTTNTVTFTVT